MVENQQQTQQEQATEPRVRCFCFGYGPKLTGFVLIKSEKARQHFRNARIEFLKALRTLIDERIEYLQRTGQKGTRVTVE